MDLLVELSKNPTTRGLIRGLGLPLPMPPQLHRSRKPWSERILRDRSVVLFGQPESALLLPLANTLAASGARVLWSGPGSVPDAVTEAAQAWAEPSRLASEVEESERVTALVADFTDLAQPERLVTVYEAIQPWVKRLKPGGRVLLLGRPPSDIIDPQAAAAQQALEGFVRSLAKELGRRGITVNLLRVTEGAEARVAGPLRFFLSRHSAFVTAQPLTVDARAKESSPGGARAALHGKVCVVTGGARGIGAATSRRMSEEGAHVVVVELPAEQTAASQLARELGGSVLPLDVASDTAPSELCAFLRQRFGGVDIVVHNAGVTRDKTLGRMDRERWDLVLGVNLNAILALNAALLGENLLRDEGRLIQMASVGGIAGNPGQTNYAASKAALIGYTRALAKELAPRGITVNAVAPGLIETKMTARMPAGIREAARRLSALNQGGLPVDVAEAVTFFAMPWASGVTGQVLRVCGGALVGA
jgi:3-oxoacyl-[acyl-carrier protein] reductase